MLRSPWLGPLAIFVAGIIGYALSDASTQTLDDVTVTIRATRDNGSPWDFGGGLPDPKVQIGDTRCEAKDKLELTCHVGKAIDGKVRVTVVDVDSSDDDPIGDVMVAPGETIDAGALHVVTTASGGRRFLPLWIALSIGAAVAIGLALLRRRHA